MPPLTSGVTKLYTRCPERNVTHFCCSHALPEVYYASKGEYQSLLALAIMKTFIVILTLLVVVCGCSAPDSRTASSRSDSAYWLIADGKLFYELGRFDDARGRLELALSQTSDAQLRTSADHYLDLIRRDIVPDHSVDSNYPRCFW